MSEQLVVYTHGNEPLAGRQVSGPVRFSPSPNTLKTRHADTREQLVYLLASAKSTLRQTSRFLLSVSIGDPGIRASSHRMIAVGAVDNKQVPRPRGRARELDFRSQASPSFPFVGGLVRLLLVVVVPRAQEQVEYRRQHSTTTTTTTTNNKTERKIVLRPPARSLS